MRAIAGIGTALTLLLTACGGGGGSGGTTMTPVGWTSGVFQAASNFVNKCAAPRSGTDPFTNQPYPDMAGTTLNENNWLRSWTNDLYLWYGEVTDRNPANYATTAAYFDVLRTMATTTSGADKDKFHFTYKTSDWEALATTGTQAGYGAYWVGLPSNSGNDIEVAYIDSGAPGPDSPAKVNGLARGAKVLFVDDVDVVSPPNQAAVDTILAGLYPGPNETHKFQVQDPGPGAVRTFNMTSADVTSTPVQNVTTLATANGTAGYMLFNDHLATSEQALFNAFTTLQAAGVNDLVLDIRYNGGGYLDIASEVAYMIAGPAQTNGLTFELTQFNSKHPSVDPVTGQAITPLPFESITQGFVATFAAGQALPHLDLPRVFVLTDSLTCSASESIINSLRGVGVTVVQIGSTTCGKPYGFYPQDNCGTTYFSIEFRGVNAMDFGDYTDGFSPQNAPTPTNATLPGCSVADDLTHELGDPAEQRLAAALNYIATPGSCPAASGLAKSLVAQQGATLAGMPLSLHSRQLRILRH